MKGTKLFPLRIDPHWYGEKQIKNTVFLPLSVYFTPLQSNNHFFFTKNVKLLAECYWSSLSRVYTVCSCTSVLILSIITVDQNIIMHQSCSKALKLFSSLLACLNSLAKKAGLTFVNSLNIKRCFHISLSC